jgi:hypothetical protein
MHDFLEDKKNKLLAAIYEGRYKDAGSVYSSVHDYARSHARLSENEKKFLNQIQAVIRRFKPLFRNSTAPEIRKIYSSLKKIISDSARQSARNPGFTDFLSWQAKLGLSPAQEKLLYKTAVNLQLTTGCSNFCTRCNEWALPLVRKHFTWPAVRKILENLAENKNDGICLYAASDPLDWEDGTANICDIAELSEQLGLRYHILTKVPRGKEHILKKLLAKGMDISVSITSKNKNRIMKIEKDMDCHITRQHDLDELLIPAGFDEDFTTIKPSITDDYGSEITPDGAFIIIPSFTSALHPFGHEKIKINRNTDFFPVKKTGRMALLADYFKPLEIYDLNETKTCLDRLLDVQVESIILDNADDSLTPPGMRSLKEYFSIFEEKPRLRRKKMSISVMKRLKGQYLGSTGFKTLPSATKKIYLKKIAGHVQLCSRNQCRALKLSAISFFLESVIQYVKTHKTRVSILRHLLKQETAQYMEKFSKWKGVPVKKLIDSPDTDAFTIFRFCVLSILAGCADGGCLDLPETHPCVYDPDTGLFMPCPSRNLSAVQVYLDKNKTQV